MSVFEIKELREHIFSYLYPKKIKKGMWVQIVKSVCIKRPQTGIPLQIYRIVKNQNNTYTIVIKLESMEPKDDNRWYRVYSYLYPFHGDIIKVVKYTS